MTSTFHTPYPTYPLSMRIKTTKQLHQKKKKKNNEKTKKPTTFLSISTVVNVRKRLVLNNFVLTYTKKCTYYCIYHPRETPIILLQKTNHRARKLVSVKVRVFC